jgi:trehalose/maltose hydrolase-like predicted phosphorylase
VLAGIDPSRSWIAYREALIADLDDAQGGTTREGIHLGAMAGTVDLPVRSFAGMTFGDDELIFTPQLPPHLAQVQFQIRYRGHRIDVTLGRNTLTLIAHRGSAPAIRVRVGPTHELLSADQTREFPIHTPGTPTVASTKEPR